MGWERADTFDAGLCVSENCNKMGVAAAWRFESGGVGSYYCNDCRTRIDGNRRKFDESEHRYWEPSGVQRGDLPGWLKRP